MIEVIELLLKDQGTIHKKWKNYLSEKHTFTIGGPGGDDHPLKLKDSLEFLKNIGDLEKNLMNLIDGYGLDTIFGILLRVGYLAKNIQLGKNVFLMQNYSA